MALPENPENVPDGDDNLTSRNRHDGEADDALNESNLAPNMRLAQGSNGIDEPGKVELISRHPDLTIVAGEEGVVFKVNSCALADHSSDWNRMLYKGWKEDKEGQTGEEWVVPLPEDNPHALRIALFAIHTGGKNMEQVLGPSILYHLTVLCDKYDLIASLKPLWRGWLDNLPQTTNDAESLAQRLWVAHKLGHQEMYKSVFYKLLRSCKQASSDSTRVEVGDQKYDLYEDDQFYSLDVLPHLERGRLALINEVDVRLRVAIDDLLQFQACCAPNSAPDWKQTCDSAMLGALYRQFSSNHVGSWLSSGSLAAVATESLDFIVGVLEAIRVNAISDAKMSKRQGVSHENCTLWKPITIDTIMALPLVTDLLPINKEGFERRAEESGIDVAPVFAGPLLTSWGGE